MAEAGIGLIANIPLVNRNMFRLLKEGARMAGAICLTGYQQSE